MVRALSEHQPNQEQPDQPTGPRQISAAFPPKLIHPLLQSACRYVVLYGGRGGGKSWAVARALLIRALKSPLRILCCREYMSSITDSQHKLLSDQIAALGLSAQYTVEKMTIYGTNGSEFRFAGIRNNVDTIRSFEGVDVAWAEEAASITSSSWQTLIPTIRKENSQIIVTFNPALQADDTYQRFVVHPPPNSEVVKLNFDENPFCPQVLLEEEAYMRQSDPDAHNNVWLGFPKVYLANAVYAKELRRAQEEGRFCKVPYDEFVPVHLFWDLGWRDSTSIILAQLCALEVHIIDFVQASKTTINEFLRILQGKGYVYGTHFLPHDAGAKSLSSNGRSIEQIMRQAGCRVRVIPREGLTDGINATRQMFPRMYIDEVKCADLLQAVRNYAWDDAHLSKPVPVHDENSHAADSLRLLAMSLAEPKPQFKPRDLMVNATPTGWMS